MIMGSQPTEYHAGSKVAALREVANHAKVVRNQILAMRRQRTERLDASPTGLSMQTLPATFTDPDTSISRSTQAVPSVPQTPAQAQEAGYLNGKLQKMQMEMIAERASQAALLTENNKLREELATRFRAGKQDAQHEANVNLLERSHANQTVAVTEQQSQKTVALPLIHIWLILCLVILMLIVFLLQQSCKGDGKSRPLPAQSVLGAVSHFMNRNYVLEISEIQVALPGKILCGDIAMTLQVGKGDQRKYATKPIEVNESNNAFLKFRDVLHFKAKSVDGPCVFSVVDRDFPSDRMAYVDVAAKELLALAHRPHGEYVRFPLTLQGMRPVPGCKNEAYLAMRLRDASKTPTGRAILTKRS